MRAPLLRYLGGRDADAIADGIGLYHTTNLIHLNERAGRTLVELLEPFIRGASGDGAT
jgi:hypothetical protein